MKYATDGSDIVILTNGGRTASSLKELNVARVLLLNPVRNVDDED